MIMIDWKEVKFSTFPNGETKFDTKDLSFNFNSLVILKYEDDGDLIKLMLIRHLFDNKNLIPNLLITYMPYSRMDRYEGTQFFTLKYIADFINSLQFKSVSIIEPHSDVTSGLINYCNVVSRTKQLLRKARLETEFDGRKDIIFYPDAGAMKRYSKLYNGKKMFGHKERDTETGEITKSEVIGYNGEKDFKVIIVDDLCSYGNTFIKAADQLRSLGASEIYLVVTHCEKSIFNGPIFKTPFIDRVFTTDSIMTYSNYHRRLSMTKLEELV